MTSIPKNIGLARVALADAGWMLMQLDLHPDQLMPCETVEHKGELRRKRLSCIFRLMPRRGKSVYLCRECVFVLHASLGMEHFDAVIGSARKDITPKVVTA